MMYCDSLCAHGGSWNLPTAPVDANNSGIEHNVSRVSSSIFDGREGVRDFDTKSDENSVDSLSLNRLLNGEVVFKLIFGEEKSENKEGKTG
jgi:hypothetical protein